MKKRVYYAVSKTGQGRIYTSCPERHEHFGCWIGESIGCISTLFMLFESDGMELPRITWKDEPVAFELAIEQV